jgi:3-isopropylmalate/(R)-2-methylmalate dehydratase small subunit
MEPFVRHTGLVVPLDRVDVDTDQIIPKQFLKRIERTGFGQFLFYDWRFLEGGDLNPALEMNWPQYRGGSILVSGRNFGCGSSREHAPWALADYGFRAVIAPSFADIFRNNCLQNGFLPIELPEDTVRQLIDRAKEQPGFELTIDLQRQVVEDGQGFSATFEIPEFSRYCLLNGLDAIGLTLQHEPDITEFEQHRHGFLPVTV